jgi:beta-galactosidase
LAAACRQEQPDLPGTAGEEAVALGSQVIPLKGTWKFTLTPPEDFWTNDVNPASWSDIEVPGECLMQGFKIKHNVGYPFKRSIEIPEDFAGHRILLCFDGVYSYARVWVNGRFVRDHHGGFTTWDCDITDLVVPGQGAWLTVEVTDRDDEISYGSGYAHHLIGGILRDVSLLAVPQDHISHLYVETDLDADYRDARLKIDASVAFGRAEEADITLSLYDGKGWRVRMRPSRLELTRNNPAGKLDISVRRPLLWDAEHPHLYTLTAELKVAGKIVQRRVQKIGFREVELVRNRLLVNGRPVKLRGACRHDVHPLLGRRSTPELDLQDALLAKEANFNFIRTSHYPPARSFLEFCDDLGLYVEEETAVCFVGTHRSPDYQKLSFSQDNPAFGDRYLNQLKEMVDRDRNHPSVIIWSIGNENLYGANFQDEFDWIKRADPTRPVIFSYPGKVPPGQRCFDILSMHYPSSQGDLIQYGAMAEKFGCGPVPVIFDEWAHVPCYNTATLREDPNVRNFWGESIKEFWDRTFESEGIGGAIWGMIDEVLLLPDGPAGYGPWGIVDGWRRKKPEFWHAKKAYSPVRVLAAEVKPPPPGEPWRIPVQNRHDHTNLRELEVRWTVKGISHSMPGPDIPPHSKGTIVIPAREGQAGDQVRLQFFQGDRCLDEELLPVGGIEAKRPEKKQDRSPGAGLRIEEANRRIRVAGEKSAFLIDGGTGLIKEGYWGNESFVLSGPYPHLRWISRPPDSNQGGFMETDPAAWRLEKMHSRLGDRRLDIALAGRMGDFKVRLDYSVTPDGAITSNYEFLDIPPGKPAEIGLAYELAAVAWVEWQREGLWSTYPIDHIGAPAGRTVLGHNASPAYREKPAGAWAADVWDYFLQGIQGPGNPQWLLSQDARSLKENFYSYVVGLEQSRGRLTAESDGRQAARLKSVGGGRYRLIILTNWDYPDLDWGNRMRPFKFEDNLAGRITVRLD